MKRITRPCIVTGQPTDTLHEIFFGTAGREICVQYGLQVPVAHNTHLHAHGRLPRSASPAHPFFNLDQEGVKAWFCDRLEIDCYLANRAVAEYKDWGFQYLQSLNLKKRNPYLNDQSTISVQIAAMREAQA